MWLTDRFAAIACADGDGPRVVQVHAEDYISSAVYINRYHKCDVGSPARKLMLCTRPSMGDGCTGFLSALGQNTTVAFPATQTFASAPQLVALVIAELLRSYAEELGEIPPIAAFAVPPSSHQRYLDELAQAAKQAGLKYVTFVHEPVASAIAFGAGCGDESAIWLVITLDAGNLSASLVRIQGRKVILEEGSYLVDYLVGSECFTRELFDYVIGPRSSSKRERYRNLVQDYSPIRSRRELHLFLEDHNNIGLLRLAVEEAERRLWTHKAAEIQINGRAGIYGDVCMAVLRSEYKEVIRPYCDRAVQLVRRLLSAHKLCMDNVVHTVVVGESSANPVFLSALANGLPAQLLNIPISRAVSVHHATAPATGAAIHLQREIHRDVEGRRME